MALNGRRVASPARAFDAAAAAATDALDDQRYQAAPDDGLNDYPNHPAHASELSHSRQENPKGPRASSTPNRTGPPNATTPGISANAKGTTAIPREPKNPDATHIATRVHVGIACRRVARSLGSDTVHQPERRHLSLHARSSTRER